MTNSTALLPLVAPLVMAIAGLVARFSPGVRPRRALDATRVASRIALAVALLTAVLAALSGAWRAPVVSPPIGWGYLSLSAQLDGLSVVMLLLVAGLGAALVRFSRNYLDGEQRQGEFLGSLCLTVATVILLVLSANLVQLVVMWSATSFALQRLLLFYPDRPGAISAARKKFIVARLGDAALICAAALLVQTFGTAELHELAQRARALAATGSVPLSLHVAALLLVATAALKAAQFPTHGWLVEMMETPTPVSALLHAGILNGGTFLIVRLAQVVWLSPLALGVLVVVGGATALLASAVMVTETRVKAGLAYSSAAHMGFMLLLCGMGAYPVAIVHLVAHSFYKAHAFLSSGSAVDAARTSTVHDNGLDLSMGRIAAGVLLALAIVLVVAGLLGVSLTSHATAPLLGGILVLALTLLVSPVLRGRLHGLAIGYTGLAALATTVSFFALDLGAASLLGASLPDTRQPHPLVLRLAGLMIATYAVATIAQLRFGAVGASRWWSALYVHVRNGMYVNGYFDRLVGAHRRPNPSPRLAVTDEAVVGERRTTPASSEYASPGHVSPEHVATAVAQATRAVAPLWPLERFVAVNPYLGLADQPFEEAAQLVAATAGARMVMPRSFYLEAIDAGHLTHGHLEAALADAQGRGRAGIPSNVAALLAEARASTNEGPRPLITVAELVSEGTGVDWSRLVVERFSSWAATYFDEGQASWRSPWRGRAAFEAWRAEAVLDATPEVLGAVGLRRAARALPESAEEVIALAVARLGVCGPGVELYLRRLLGTIGGWAGYARHRQWERELRGEADDTVQQLLAVRLAWELLLLDVFDVEAAWSIRRRELQGDAELVGGSQLEVDLVLQAAYDRSWQERLDEKLAHTASPTASPAATTGSKPAPTVQAAFCIDVRSERYRRALERVEPHCDTLGFAGFFGFPVEYVRLGDARGGAHCPVLLAPKATIVETHQSWPEDLNGTATERDGAATGRLAHRRLGLRRAAHAWQTFKTSAVSCFGFVGPVGLTYALKLATDGLGRTRPVPHPARAHVDTSCAMQLGPELSPTSHDGRAVGLTDQERVAMAEGLLRGMSLTAGFARIVLLVGHGATTVNNPHAAGLDCGACGGQTGEANARIAARVLNLPEVRAALATRNIHVGDDTVFVAALHDTTTDEVTLLDRAALPTSHGDDLRRLESSLSRASAIVRAERAKALHSNGRPSTEAAVAARSRDWSQVRPEWGLAGCAAFIVAPRHRTAVLDLDGRAFLHSYDWRSDPELKVLELIMTAPMVVTSWINLQYYGSTVDNRAFGCGNKVLHNVVGTIGVQEGNGGDLRSGLPWQSIHDGERFVHEPRRLQVLIEAPVAAMNAVLEKHPSVRALVDNGWLYLGALGDAGAVTHRYVGELNWTTVAPQAVELAA